MRVSLAFLICLVQLLERRHGLQLYFYAMLVAGVGTRRFFGGVQDDSLNLGTTELRRGSERRWRLRRLPA